MGDSKVKVAVRIRPMNRRGESRAHPGPPRRRRQVPGAPFPSRRPPCGVQPPRPRSPYSGRRAAGTPRNLVPRTRLPAQDAPPLARTASRGAAGPTSRSAAPSARAPAPPPFRPLSSLAFPGGRPVPRPRLGSSFCRSCPLARASQRPCCLLSSCQCGPRPLGPHPSGLAGTARDPEAPSLWPSRPTLHFGGPRQEKWQGI